MIFGWGNNGWGGGFGGNGALQGALTRGDLCQDMNFNNLESAVRGVQQGLCDGFYAMNTGMLNGFAGVQQTLCQGFSGVNSSIYQSGTDTRFAINDLSHQLATCCCDFKQIALENRYLNERQACDLITNQNANTQRIVDLIQANKIDELNRKLTIAENSLNQCQNNAYLLGQLQPTPKPTYNVPNPFASYDGCGCCGCRN